MTTHRILRIALPSCAALLVAVATPARGEGGAGTVYSGSSYPYGELVRQPLTLPTGVGRLDLPLSLNLSKEQVGNPVSIPAALDVGVTNDVQLGLFHGTGLCLSGTANGCPYVYDDLGGRVVVSIARDRQSQLALRGAIYARSLHDGLWDAILGVAYKRTMGNVGLVLDASYDVGVTDRDRRLFEDALAGNAELQLQLARGVAAFGRIGVVKFLWSDAPAADFWVPVGLGFEVEPVRKVSVGAELTFPNLLGEDGSSEEREGSIFVRLFF